MYARWLKNYTKLEYAEDVLTTCTLHLSDPSVWTDKNDATFIRSYSEAICLPQVCATCLTSAADRFYFWTVFGSHDQGICFWFDTTSLIADITKDETLIAQ